MSERFSSMTDNIHSFYSDCEDCGIAVEIVVDSLEHRGEIPVLCMDCAWLIEDDDGCDDDD